MKGTGTGREGDGHQALHPPPSSPISGQVRGDLTTGKLLNEMDNGDLSAFSLLITMLGLSRLPRVDVATFNKDAVRKKKNSYGGAMGRSDRRMFGVNTLREGAS